MEFTRLPTDWPETKQQELLLEEILPKPLVAQTMQPYYRSKVFISDIGINPLAAAAAPLFFLVENAQKPGITLSVQELRENLVHEIKAFDNQAQTHGYKPNIVLAAHFALGLWIDEMILNTTWGKESGWDQQCLVERPPYSNQDAKSIFFLLNHCLQDPETYIDLLELLYVCLSLGYEGEYRYLERGHILLAEIRDNVYQYIQRQRGEVSKKLDIEDSQIQVVKQGNFWPQILLRGISILLTISLAIISYLLLNHQLQHSLQSAQTSFQRWVYNSNTLQIPLPPKHEVIS